MIYKYIFKNNSLNFIVLIIFLIFLISYSFNKINYTSKGVLGIFIGIFIGWILMDRNITNKRMKVNNIDIMVNSDALFQNLGEYEEALNIFYKCLSFSKYNILEFKNSIKYFLEMMEFYKLIKQKGSYNIFYQTKLEAKYYQCINSFKSIELNLSDNEMSFFYKKANELNNLLLGYLHECNDINNKDINDNNYNIFKRKILYKDPKEYNYNSNYNSNLI